MGRDTRVSGFDVLFKQSSDWWILAIFDGFFVDVVPTVSGWIWGWILGDVRVFWGCWEPRGDGDHLLFTPHFDMENQPRDCAFLGAPWVCFQLGKMMINNEW